MLAADADICPICGRPLGQRRERHHLVPRSYKGTETVEVRPICHRKIHATFGERELALEYNTPARLRGHPDIEKFVRWVAGRPPDFHRRTRRPRRP